MAWAAFWGFLGVFGSSWAAIARNSEGNDYNNSSNSDGNDNDDGDNHNRIDSGSRVSVGVLARKNMFNRIERKGFYGKQYGKQEHENVKSTLKHQSSLTILVQDGSTTIPAKQYSTSSSVAMERKFFGVLTYDPNPQGKQIEIRNVMLFRVPCVRIHGHHFL